MKVRVTDNVKGEIRIEAMERTYPKGTEITMDDDQFLHSATQMAIRANFLEVVEGSLKQLEGLEFRCLYKNPLSIRCIGRAIAPGEVFYVNADDIDDTEIETALAAKFIIKEVDYQKKLKRSGKLKTVEEVVEKEEAEEALSKSEEENKSEEEAKARRAANAARKREARRKAKEAKKAEEEANRSEAEAQSKMDEELSEKKKQEKTEMHVHIPDEVKDEIKPLRVPVSQDILELDLDLDSPENIGELPFVDKQQAEEAKFRLKNLAGDNEEVV